MKTLFIRIKRNVINTMVIREKYKSIPYVIAILFVLFVITKIVYEFIFLR